MRFIVALICVLVVASGCEPSKPKPTMREPSKPKPTMRERFEATEKLLSAWDKDIKGSRADYVRILISEGADVNAEDKDGRTPLLHACVKDDAEIITLLVYAGADVNAEYRSQWTPLMIVCLGGHLEVVDLLIEAGADVNAKGNDGETPLSVCYNEAVKKLLIDAGAKE